MKQKIFLLLSTLSLAAFSLSVLAAGDMASDRISDIRNTKHNFATDDVVDLPNGDTRDVVSSENQVCVFCHTPHGDPNKTAKAFLWNRSDSAATLTNADKYTSSSLNILAADVVLGAKSKMCLSCHDGTVAIGQVDMNNSLSLSGVTTPSSVAPITMSGDSVSGDKLIGNSNLGTDFKNDHPVGFLYDGALSGSDNELIDPTAPEGDHIGVRASRKVTNFNQALNADGSAGAAGSDNPTTVSTRISVPLESAVAVPTGGQTTFVSVGTSGRVECTTCHDPHIRSTTNTENIKFLRLHRFQKASPTGGAFDINNDINCLACHKKAGWAVSAHATETDAPHTFLSAEATSREISSTKAVWETSCLGCHDTHTVDDARWLLRQPENATAFVSDVDNSCYECHSNTSVLDPVNGSVADIESIALTGGHATFAFTAGDTAHRPVDADLTEASADLQVRHAVCSDCHNPHRLTKGLHANTGSSMNNEVSGALSGISGLDALDVGGSFDPYSTSETITPLPAGVAEKEYQICFKCHSSYGHGVANISAAGFSNTVMEFSSNASSFHPVVDSGTNTNIVTGLLEAPFDSGENVQTMYCSDCHTNTDNSAVNNGTGSPSGPKGTHNNNIAVCETCHVSAQYNYDVAAIPLVSGFACLNVGDCPNADGAGLKDNLHVYHAQQNASNTNICSNCHVKVPHGWRNKALLADISQAGNSADKRYYGGASDLARALSDINDIMPASGAWLKTDCTAACHLDP